MKKYIAPVVDFFYIEHESTIAAESTNLIPTNDEGEVDVVNWVEAEDIVSDYEW